MFSYNSNVRYTDIRDGQSFTIMVGERNSSIDYSTWVGAVHGAKFAITRIVGSTVRVPNDPHAEFEDFSSHHPAGAQFVMADGSVRMIYSEIKPSVFEALGTRWSREVIDAKDLE